MTAPFVQVFIVDGKPLSSVVVSESDFESVVSGLLTGRIISMEQAKTFRELKHIPLVFKGPRTQFLFTRFHVETEYMCMIVRGHGMKLLEQMTEHSKKHTASQDVSRN